MQNLHIILIVLLCLISCQKYSYIENELHGLWQVASVEDKITSELTHAQGDLYYSFQRNMVILSYNGPNKPTGLMMTQYISDFTLNNDTIEIDNFRVHQEYDKKAPLTSLKKFGIHDEHTTFHIERDKKGILILESEKARIELQRY